MSNQSDESEENMHMLPKNLDKVSYLLLNWLLNNF